MTATAGATRGRHLLAPEVVQTSAMDCGPATLKALAGGHGIPVHYGRLREACQTDVDGTSIDALEEVANQLGIRAEQVMIPADHVFLREAHCLPAIVVTRRSDGATHFVIAWAQQGPWLQVMDPAVGRYWIRPEKFAADLYRHEISVAASDWREWAASPEFLTPLRARIAGIGMPEATIDAIVAEACADPGWFALGVLDATTRFVHSVAKAGGLGNGNEAAKVLRTLFDRTRHSPGDIFSLVTRDYWSVVPDPQSRDAVHQRLLLRGAVLVKAQSAESRHRQDDGTSEHAEPVSPEVTAALTQTAERPLAALWRMLGQDGLTRPAVLAGVMAIASGAVLFEALMFRGIFDLAAVLNAGSQRLLAALALLAFLGILLAIRLPIVAETLRMGRHLDVRLRMALLEKLPRLSDRYFHSRPISDMADRAHSIPLVRQVPGMGVQFVQLFWELLFTLLGVAWIAPASLGWALVLSAAGVAIPLVLQPLLNERDLRVRNHAASLHGFYLDALLGLVPVRTHGAEPAVRRQHEGLLVDWARASRSLAGIATVGDAIQSLLCLGLAGGLLVEHFLRAKGISGADLLLVYWTLKLPSTAGGLSSLAHQYPAQRNVLMRLLEPLSAPDELSAAHGSVEARHPPARMPMPSTPVASPASVQVRAGKIVAGGHPILEDVNVEFTAGEHVAIVGASGAGKSTLLGLMLGWHRLAEGQWLLDGMDMSSASLEQLRQRTAWLDPAIQVWNRSFLENLRYATDGDGIDDVDRILSAADLKHVLQKLPQGLQSYLGEGGTLLSGGEGQRMRLARALLQSNVRLALLDEPFRGIDRSQRVRLLDEAREWWKDVTLLCVTHDVTETLSFPRVLVVNQGRIVEDGDPRNLASRPSRYRELLQAERVVREELWSDPRWRRLRVGGGTVAAGPSHSGNGGTP